MPKGPRGEKRPADVPGVLGETVEFVGEPALDDGVPGGDTIGAATVGTKEAEGAERGHGCAGIARAGRHDDASAGGDGRLADWTERLPRVALGDVDVEPPDVVVSGAQTRCRPRLQKPWRASS